MLSMRSRKVQDGKVDNPYKHLDTIASFLGVTPEELKAKAIELGIERPYTPTTSSQVPSHLLYKR